MISVERHDPQKERVCDTCEWSDVCRFRGVSPLVFEGGSEVKCVSIDQGSSSETILIPTEVRVSRSTKVEGFSVTVHRFRQGKLWRWLRRTFA